MTSPFETRFSNSRAPNYDTKRAVAAVVSGQKKTHSEADYKPASEDSRRLLELYW